MVLDLQPGAPIDAPDAFRGLRYAAFSVSNLPPVPYHLARAIYPPRPLVEAGGGEPGGSRAMV